MTRPFKQHGSYNLQPVGAGHAPTIAPALPGRRPQPEYESFPSQQPQQQRTLQPRPPRSTDSPIPNITNGEVSNMIRPVTLSEPSHEPQRKKRGRPSKEEAEERDRALAAEGKVYQPKKRPAKKIRPSSETPASARSGDVASFVIRTPTRQTPEMQKEGSSGKRHQIRPSEDKHEHRRYSVVERADSLPPGARSPSDRLLATHRERDLDMLLSRGRPQSPPEVTTKTEDKEQ